MPETNGDAKKPFQLDWKSLGFGAIAGALLLAIIMAAGGRVEEWNFGIVKVVIPTAVEYSTSAPNITDAERVIESVSDQNIRL